MVKKSWHDSDSNSGPSTYGMDTLPAELSSHTVDSLLIKHHISVPGYTCIQTISEPYMTCVKTQCENSIWENKDKDPLNDVFNILISIHLKHDKSVMIKK